MAGARALCRGAGDTVVSRGQLDGAAAAVFPATCHRGLDGGCAIGGLPCGSGRGGSFAGGRRELDHQRGAIAMNSAAGWLASARPDVGAVRLARDAVAASGAATAVAGLCHLGTVVDLVPMRWRAEDIVQQRQPSRRLYHHWRLTGQWRDRVASYGDVGVHKRGVRRPRAAVDRDGAPAPPATSRGGAMAQASAADIVVADSEALCGTHGHVALTLWILLVH